MRLPGGDAMRSSPVGAERKRNRVAIRAVVCADAAGGRKTPRRLDATAERLCELCNPWHANRDYICLAACCVGGTR